MKPKTYNKYCICCQIREIQNTDRHVYCKQCGDYISNVVMRRLSNIKSGIKFIQAIKSDRRFRNELNRKT